MWKVIRMRFRNIKEKRGPPENCFLKTKAGETSGLVVHPLEDPAWKHVDSDLDRLRRPNPRFVPRCGVFAGVFIHDDRLIQRVFLEALAGFGHIVPVSFDSGVVRIVLAWAESACAFAARLSRGFD